jgi:DNA invertase Pin-like site-specific DNA recombinase
LRAVIYARYSSENQREASIEDQIRTCRALIEARGWTYGVAYTDRAASGATPFRAGYQQLLEDARTNAFDVVVTESLDRLSRDQADVAALYKRLGFLGIGIVTLAEGEISELHVGLKGTMNALYLKDLAQKTRRGLEGRVRQGRSGGGLCYGYAVVRETDVRGEPVRGGRAINEAEAAVVRRIFERFAAGEGPRAIARSLNAAGIPGPAGRAWGFSTINGSIKRANGILNNELYIGRLVWNRQRFIKDPATGKRVSRPNPREAWVIQEVPELRLVEPELWDEVQARQAALKSDRRSGAANRFRDRRRPKHLLSGLTRCGVCGGAYSLISATLLGCSTARNKGTCANRLNIRRDGLEARILNALQHHLMDPTLFQAFCEEFTREVNRLRREGRAALEAERGELARVERQIRALIEAIKAGMFQPSMKAELDSLEARKAALTATLAQAEEPPPLLHPNMAMLYRERVAALHEALNQEEVRVEAAVILRSLISAIVLTPADGALGVALQGDLAGILAVAANAKRPSENGRRPGSGEGFDALRFKLKTA